MKDRVAAAFDPTLLSSRVSSGGVVGDTYLTFNYSNAYVESDYRLISKYASLAHWEDLNLTPEWIDLGGEG